jgi:hypothetical protein
MSRVRGIVVRAAILVLAFTPMLRAGEAIVRDGPIVCPSFTRFLSPTLADVFFPGLTPR